MRACGLLDASCAHCRAPIVRASAGAPAWPSSWPSAQKTRLDMRALCRSGTVRARATLREIEATTAPRAGMDTQRGGARRWSGNQGCGAGGQKAKCPRRKQAQTPKEKGAGECRLPPSKPPPPAPTILGARSWRAAQTRHALYRSCVPQGLGLTTVSIPPSFWAILLSLLGEFRVWGFGFRFLGSFSISAR